MRITLLATPFSTPRMPPLGVALLSAVLRSEGHEVAVIDLNHHLFHRGGQPDRFRYSEGWRWKDPTTWIELQQTLIQPLLSRMLYEVALTRPEFIGISAWHGEFSADLAGRLRRQHPQVPIVVGGPAASRSFGSLRLRPGGGIDAVVSGEGESALSRLTSVFERSGTLVALPGVELLQDGKMIDGGPPLPPDQLDLFPPPDFSDFTLQDYDDPDFGGGPALPLLHFRGCPGQCAFCLDREFWGGGHFRHPTAARTAQTVANLYDRHQIAHFVFLDLCINPARQPLLELTDALTALSLPLDFCAQARCNGQWDNELADRLRKAGFIHLTLGLESASDRILQKMHKGYDSKAASRVIHACHQAGILINLNLIAGFPGETAEDRLETLQFIQEHAAMIWSAPSITACACSTSAQLGRDPDKFCITPDSATPQDPEEWLDRETGATKIHRQQTRDDMLKAINSLRYRRDQEADNKS